jgi:hypothetical protein
MKECPLKPIKIKSWGVEVTKLGECSENKCAWWDEKKKACSQNLSIETNG